MQIRMLKQSWVYPNEPESVPKLMETLMSHLDETDYLIESMEVDGVPIYGDYEHYLYEHLHTVERVEVCVQTAEQMLQEALLSASQYAKDAVPNIRKLADAFYGGKDDQAWEGLGDLMEGLQWLGGVVPAAIGEDRFMEINDRLEQLVAATDQRDKVTIGDLLLYEIAPFFERLDQALASSAEGKEE